MHINKIKRLEGYFLSLEKTNTSYNIIYEGKYYDPRDMATYYDPIYEGIGGIAYHVERTHKMSLDKPTVTIKIPVTRLKIKNIEHKTAITDFISRSFCKYIGELNAENQNRNRSDKENGRFYFYEPTGEVLERNVCYITNDSELGSENDYYINIMIMIQLPARNHKKASRMVCKHLPKVVEDFVLSFDNANLNKATELYKTQTKMREWLRNSEYCAFVANGSILPRKGNSPLPADNAVPFMSPIQDEIEIFGMKGMGIKKGVTVITGGGYSGKSTLLDAISAGIYNHIGGDGREYVITDDTAVKISAEDSRSIKNVNLSPFIKWLPSVNGDTAHFSTAHASGSTSQAANIIEAVNFGAELFLIDEDKSATNFMIRDKMMKSLIEKEPITPFTERVRQLYAEAKVSTILVIGGSGEYLSVADNIIMMEDFRALNATSNARKICVEYKAVQPLPDDTRPVQWRCRRRLAAEGFTSYPSGDRFGEYYGTEKLEISDMGFILIGNERIDIRMLHNIISFPQLTAVGYILRYLEISNKEDIIDIDARLDELFETINAEGLGFVYSTAFRTERWLDMPRKCEVQAVINRMRHVNFIN